MRPFNVIFIGVAIASTFRDLVMYVFEEIDKLYKIIKFQRQTN